MKEFWIETASAGFCRSTLEPFGMKTTDLKFFFASYWVFHIFILHQNIFKIKFPFIFCSIFWYGYQELVLLIIIFVIHEANFTNGLAFLLRFLLCKVFTCDQTVKQSYIRVLQVLRYFSHILHFFGDSDLLYVVVMKN